MWCVRVRGGQFRSAVDGDGVVAWSLPSWRALDPAAANQYTEARRMSLEAAELAFISATGLDRSDKIGASIRQAHRRYGGLHVTTSSSSRLRG